MRKKPNILFVCTGNSARSQMAEGFCRYFAGEQIQVASAGTNPVGLNPTAVWAMNEVGIDISDQASTRLADVDLSRFDWFITLCHDAEASCPPVPTGGQKEHWPLTDPAKTRGPSTEVLKAFRAVRNEIERRVKNLLTTILR